MGKVSKAVKTVAKPEKNSKVKKLLNNPGVSKASAKVNLKEARVPSAKILKNELQTVDKNVNLIEVVKSLKKNKKNISKPLGKSVKPKPESKTEQVPIMKTLKRKSTSENTVKLPIPKKKGTSPVASVKKQTEKKPVEESKSEKTPKVETKIAKEVEKKIVKEVEKKVAKEVEKKISTTNPEPQQSSRITIDKAQVAKGVSAVLKLAKLQAEKKKNLFDGEHQPIFLQVSCIKVPKVPRRQLRIMLPNTLVTDTDDVALFVGDLKKGRAQDFEPTINHYEDLLREHGCTRIKDVIPLTQVKTEFDQYELKRKLLSSYDYFLTDGKIAGHLSHLLGKIFINKRKLPTSIKMESKNLKLEIDNALKKTSMQLHSHGNSHILQVAHTAMKKQEILENVIQVCKNLAQSYPGGWINVRSLILKTATSLPVPIYITLKSKNKVKVPVVTPKRPKAHQILSGELSTALGNAKAVVKPDGTVTVYRDRKKHNKKDGESAEKKPTLTTNESTSKKSKQNKKKSTEAEGVKVNRGTKKNNGPSTVSSNLDGEDSEDLSEPETKTKRFEDSEDEIEEAEQAYLSRWQEETITSTTTEEKKPKKKAKIVKKKKSKA